MKVYPTKARTGGATCTACSATIAEGQPLVKVAIAATIAPKLYCQPCADTARKAVEAAIAGLLVSALESLEPRPEVELAPVPECLLAAFDAATDGGL